MNELELQLQKIGLSDKESRIYLSLLSTGPVTAREVANLANINRSTTYVILEALVKKGLVGSIDQNKIRKYSAVSPERLVSHIEEQVRDFTNMIGQVNSLLPQLKSIYTGVGPKPKIQYFEDSEGIKTVYEDTLNASETIRAFASIDNMHQALGDYFPEYYHRRTAKGIHIRSIHPDTKASQERVKHNKTESREAVLIPQDKFGFTPEINIYDNKIAFMSLTENHAMVIESKELADALKKIFELAWIGSKSINKKG